MTLYLQLDEYLAQWFIHNHGGAYPVKLVRGSLESAILELFLKTPPNDYVPEREQPGCVAIEIPNFRNKDPRDNYYLPPKARDALVACIRNRFDFDMWTALHRFSNILKRQDNLIYAFMEKNGIELSEKNWNAIAKRYQRKRDIYKRMQRRKNFKKNNPDFRG